MVSAGETTAKQCLPRNRKKGAKKTKKSIIKKLIAAMATRQPNINQTSFNW
jgi:hypothetical protein